MAAPLSHKQKRYLSQLSHRAYDYLAAEADGSTDERLHAELRESEAREQFRHDQVASACGKHGLRCCSQDDYKRVEAHFLDLLGETARAFDAHLRAETEPRRQAEAVLVRECARFGLALGYAAAICSRQFRCDLADATTQQVWNLVYTIRNRGAARARQAQAA